MRKIAPLAFTMIATFIAGTAVAATNTTTSVATPTEQMSASPTVPANTQNPQGMSYSDKSNTSPGTNAKMDDSKSMMDKSMMDKNAMTTDPIVEKRNEKRKKAKLAKNTDSSMTRNTDSSMTRKTDSNMMKTTPIDTSTNAAAAKSTTGASGGQ